MIVVVKLGTSSLVDGDGELRGALLERRAAELTAALRRGHRPVLVSSGAVACGLSGLGIAARAGVIADLQAASAVGQGVLYPRWSSAFAAEGVTAAQVLLTSQDLDRRESYLNARATLERLLELGVVPVVNENDTTATDELTFGDNDVLAAQVAILLGAGALYLLTDRDGLYGGDPSNPRRIEEVPADTPASAIELADMGRSSSGRGGVASKIASARMATAAGIDCVIASGLTDGVIDDLLAGTARGTRFLPGARREGAFKLWLRHAKPAMGRVHVDAGAARALAERGTSLLPVGVTRAEGDFGPGDAVEIWVEGASAPLGKGIADLSADDLRRVAGMKSDAVAERLPGCEEVIHRDRLVLLPAEP